MPPMSLAVTVRSMVEENQMMCAEGRETAVCDSSATPELALKYGAQNSCLGNSGFNVNRSAQVIARPSTVELSQQRMSIQWRNDPVEACQHLVPVPILYPLLSKLSFSLGLCRSCLP
jgi:hypothetical protein